jgi:hypothetical protein
MSLPVISRSRSVGACFNLLLFSTRITALEIEANRKLEASPGSDWFPRYS